MDPALREVIAEGRNRPDDDEIEVLARLTDPTAVVEGLRIVSRFGPIATGRVPRSRIVRVWSSPQVISLKAPRLGEQPQTTSTASEARRPNRTKVSRRPPAIGHSGTGVVIGIVDWGCDVDHAHLKNADATTRILALWDQRTSSPRLAPRPYGYGRVHSRAAIDAALATARPYDTLGYHPSEADRDGSGAHGTHVADIAAGNGVGGGPVGVAPDADVVFVHLANRGTSGLATLGDSLRILEAVDFVARAARDRPWVVNCSLGRHGGPHDGCTLTELGFDALLMAAPGRFLVQSAGNYFDKDIHASGRLRTGDITFLKLLVDPADVTPNELEIWYGRRDAMSVRVQSPTGVTTRWVPLEDHGEIVEDDRVVGRLYHRERDPNNLDHHVDLFLYPDAPPGQWTVWVRADRVVDGEFHAWIERDLPCDGCQTRFHADDVDSRYTIGSVANGRLPAVVGAYDANDPTRPLATPSSSGPTRDGRRKPDLLAPGVGVLAARSAPAGSTTSPGLLIRKSGTSMAAPHVTGAVALCLEAAGRPLWATEIRRLLLESSRPARGLDPQRSGAGYLDIPRLVDAVVGRTSARRARGRNRRSRPIPAPGAPVVDAGQREHVEGHRRESTTMRATNESPVRSRPRTRRQHGPRGRGPVQSRFPADVYRSLLHGGLGTTALPFTVLGRPGHTPIDRPRRGDLMIRIALGEPGPGHLFALADVADRDSSPQPPEAGVAGLFAVAVDRLGRSPRRLRRVLDDAGRVPPGQLLLRPIHADGYPAQVAGEQAAPSSDHSAVDQSAAVPGFSATQRANVRVPLLLPAQSRRAATLNAAWHPRRSGLQIADIRAALERYVDFDAITAALVAHDAGGGAGIGADANAVLTEALHQFQLKCYREPTQHDGIAGASTLDSLGFIARVGLRTTYNPQARAVQRLRAQADAVARATDQEFTADNWFNHMLNPAVLGERFNRPVHLHLVRRLRVSERHLLTRLSAMPGTGAAPTTPVYWTTTPVELGRALGVNETLKGGRDASPQFRNSRSMHTFGLAVDISYRANPWIRRDPSYQALRRAALLTEGLTIVRPSVPAIWHDLTVGHATTTTTMYLAIKRHDDQLREYVALSAPQQHDRLIQLLERHRATGTADIFTSRDEPIDRAAARWRRRIELDVRALWASDFYNHGHPRDGFLNLHIDLVAALRDEACLAWGGTDFGPRQSGDMMHFDARADGVGRVLNVGRAAPPTHPCVGQRTVETSPSEATEPSESVVEPAQASAVDLAGTSVPAEADDAAGMSDGPPPPDVVPADSTDSTKDGSASIGDQGQQGATPPRYGGFSLRRGDRDSSRTWGGAVRQSLGDHVDRLQRDLASLGFSVVGNADGQFSRYTEWGVREFQIYAKMAHVAAETGTGALYADRLTQVANRRRYSGPVSGVVNADTRDLIAHWREHHWRCPVVVEAWNMRGGRRHSIHRENIWRHNDVTSPAPRMFVRDLTTRYGATVTARVVLGDYARYLGWSGPRSIPPRHTAASAELLPEHLLGVQLAQLSVPQRSTYKVVRSVAEVECIGFFDSVNSYDNAFVSVGPAHWTLAIADRAGRVDRGELPAFLAYLHHTDPGDYATAFGFYGLRPELDWVDPQGRATGGRLFSASQRKYVGRIQLEREAGGHTTVVGLEREFDYFKTWHWFVRFVMAGRAVPAYRRRMWDMARIRIRDLRSTQMPANVVPNIPVSSGNTRRATIGDVFTSERATALIMRWHIRAPTHIVRRGEAGPRVTEAVQRANIPATAGDPTRWTDQHEQALTDGIMAEAMQHGSLAFQESMRRVRDFPIWAPPASNIRNFALHPGIGQLAARRDSLDFDATGLPPAP